MRLIAAGCAATLVAVLALVLSSGGGDSGTLVPGSAVADAAAATAHVRGVSVEGDAKIDAPGLPHSLVMHMQGVSDLRGHARMTGVYQDFPGAGGDVRFDMIALLPHFYMKSPLFQKALPAGKSWVDFDLAKLGRKMGIGDPTQFQQTSDPSQTLQNLRAVSPKVERVGSDDVRGVRTVHYRGTVELRRLVNVVPPGQRTAAKQRVERLIQLTGADSYPIEVWIDGRHLVRRMRYEMHLKVKGRPVTADTTIEMFDFGPKQKAKRPPASQTIDVTQLSGAGAGP